MSAAGFEAPVGPGLPGPGLQLAANRGFDASGGSRGQTLLWG